MLALLGNDVKHDFGDFLLVAACLLFNLGEAGRVDVECLNVDQDLVVVDLVHVVVELVSGLGEYANGVKHAVCAVFVSFFLHGS